MEGSAVKKEWILWNVLQNPENITSDERMELIEWKNYYWSYKALIWLLFALAMLWPGLISLSQSYMGRDTGIEILLRLLVIELISIIESGRFLYSCYFGNQEFYDRNSGKTSYYSIGLQISVISWIIFWGGYGVRHPLPWIMMAAGPLLYWGLCHLAYLHYALLMDESKEDIGRKCEAWIPGVCGVLLAVYFIILNVFAFTARIDRVTMSRLPEEEQYMINTIEQGITNYYSLTDYRLDYRLETDIQPEAPVYDENNAYDLSHAYCLASGEKYYNQIFDPGKENTIYREYYRESEDPFSWKMAYDGRWISETDWAELWTEHQDEPEFWIEPYTGIPGLNPQAITSVTKEEQNQNTCYTITFNENYNTSGATLKAREELKNFTATERYILNEYNTLIKYEHTETGLTKTTEEPRTLKRTITVLSVNKKEIQSEIQTFINQYQNN